MAVGGGVGVSRFFGLAIQSSDLVVVGLPVGLSLLEFGGALVAMAFETSPSDELLSCVLTLSGNKL